MRTQAEEHAAAIRTIVAACQRHGIIPAIITPDGEAARDDERYAYAAAWEFTGVGNAPVLHKEPLTFEYVHPTQRSYK